MVREWLTKYMLRNEKKAKSVAEFFIGEMHLNHGSPIGLAQIKRNLDKYGFKTQVLEENSELQDAVLTTYHLMTLFFEHTAGLKVIRSADQTWQNFIKPLLLRKDRSSLFTSERTDFSTGIFAKNKLAKIYINEREY